MSTLDNLKRRMIAEVIEREGGYVNHPADRGGPTCWGITLQTARANGYEGDMRALPRQLAARIYARRYWNSLKLDEVGGMHAGLAAVLFDFGVNSGPGNSAKYLQVQLNVLNDRGRHYPDIAEDGAFGPATLQALRAYAASRGNEGLDVLSQTVNAERIVFCRRLAQRTESQEAFAYGWFRRVVELLSHVLHQQPVPHEWIDEVEAA